MSSIAAAWQSGTPPEHALVERMLTAAPHRGAQCTFLSTGWVVLGVSNGQGQSWASLGESGRWACAIHGPVDNARELCELGGEREVATALAALVARKGADALDLVRGTFAGVVTNGQELICFRDHLGGRPLFFRQESSRLFVATEAKQVVAGAGIQRQPDLAAIELMFYRGIGPEAAVKGVSRVFYGETVTLSPERQPQRHRYWRPEEVIETRPISAADAPEFVAQRLEEAIQRTVSGSDVVALSGGIDSPTVAAFAAPHHFRKSGKPLRAYTAVYPRHGSVDESRYTNEIANFLSIDLQSFAPQAGFLDDIERWVDVADGPWDSLPMATALEGYRLAASMGAKQVLTGTLAEYAFTINRFILGHLLLRRRWKALGALLSVRRAAGRSVMSLAKQLLYETTPSPLGKFWARMTRHKSSFHPPWIDTAVYGGSRYVTTLLHPMRRRWIEPTIQATRGTTSTQEAIEVCASTVGIVVRTPLADRDLWEAFLSLPVEAKFPDLTPKSILRKAMRGRLPDSILDRRDKTVFDEHVLDSVPWPRISELINDPDYRMPGVDYAMLQDRIANRKARATEVVWAQDLATVHAFIKLFK
ncbi:MAG TPA: asparagine synthase-related protein [Acidimicrobiia bacterium]|nr:asparagine synthase-related protein [Acidimicrobiia bacterium]